MTRFCFINGKTKKKPKRLELDTNVAKTRVILHFSAGSSKFRGKQRIPQRGVKNHVPRNTADPADVEVNWTLTSVMKKQQTEFFILSALTITATSVK